MSAPAQATCSSRDLLAAFAAGAVATALVGVRRRRTAANRADELRAELDAVRRRGEQTVDRLRQELDTERAQVSGLESAMRVRDDFIAVAGHELRSPLTVIRGYAEELDGDDLSEEKRAQLAIVVRRAALMAELVDDLFDLAKLDARLEPMVFVPLQLDDLVRDAVAALRPEARTAGVRFRVSAAPLLVAGEDGRLRRMFGNLLSNAVKYSPEGGNVSVNLTPDGTDALLSVSDSGIGIPTDELDRVFDRLFRASNAVDGEFPGTGLGLAITRAIVEAHGGSVIAQHGHHGGAKFTVRLPLAKPAEETATR